jgi:cation transport ATPase
MDEAETAAFVGRQVSEAIAPEEEQKPKGFFARFRRRKEEGDPAPAEDNVVAMPSDPLQPIKELVHGVQDRANEFADNMFQSEPVDEQTRLVQDNTPGTDQEQSKPEGKVKKPKRARSERHVAPDLSARELSRRYANGLTGMGRRTWGVLAISVLLLLLGAGRELGWPMAGLSAVSDAVIAGMLTWGLALAAVLGLDVIWMGLSAPVRGKTGLHTLTALAVIATLLDGLVYLLPGREGPLPLCGLAALSLFGAMWGAYDRKKALYISCRAVSGVTEPYRVTLDEDKWDGNPAFEKETGNVKDFGSQIQSTDGCIRICRVVVPVLLVAAVVLAVLAALAQGKPSMVLWCLAVILVGASPVTSLLCYGQPLLRMTKRLDRYGAVLAGWDGVVSMTGEANILIKDEDLFPAGCVTLTDVRYFGDASEERVVACVASMLRKAGCGTARLFEDQLKMKGGFFRRVDDMEYFEAGGLSANIRGERVLVGTDSYLAVNRVPMESRVRPAVYCVINDKLQGMFKLDYNPSHYVRPALKALLNAGVAPVLVTRDFNLTPGMLERLDIPADQMEYPPIQRRRELSEPGQEHGPVLGALLLREGLGAFSDAVVGGRRLYHLTRLNTILALVASLIGLLLTAYLASQMAFASLSVVNMLTFLLLWLVPNLLVSGFADKF